MWGVAQKGGILKKILLTMLVMSILLPSCQRMPEEVGVPKMIFPALNGTINTSTPTFDWYDVEDATYYQILVDDQSDFETPVISVEVLSSEYTPTTPLINGDYWWCVRAWDCSGGT